MIQTKMPRNGVKLHTIANGLLLFEVVVVLHYVK